jgi:hypothetical protein
MENCMAAEGTVGRTGNMAWRVFTAGNILNKYQKNEELYHFQIHSCENSLTERLYNEELNCSELLDFWTSSIVRYSRD